MKTKQSTKSRNPYGAEIGATTELARGGRVEKRIWLSRAKDYKIKNKYGDLLYSYDPDDPQLCIETVLKDSSEGSNETRFALKQYKRVKGYAANKPQPPYLFKSDLSRAEVLWLFANPNAWGARFKLDETRAGEEAALLDLWGYRYSKRGPRIWDIFREDTSCLTDERA